MGVKRSNGFKPLVTYPNRAYFYYKGGLYTLIDDMPVRIVSLFSPCWKDCNRMLVRLFRREPKFAVPIDERLILIAYHHRIVIVDIGNGTKKTVAVSRKDFTDPLNICVTSEKWIAVWGDYGSNAQHEEVNVYGLTKDLKTEIAYTFPPNTVRHVHNIIPKLHSGFYIFTGDQEISAGIYECDAAFKNVKPIKTGEQKYRAVIGFDTPKGLLYATDAVNEPNHIYLLLNSCELQEVCNMNGSCIHGRKITNGFLFSTTVEPDENINGIRSWISTKKGVGIISNDVHLVFVNHEMQCKVVRNYKKDLLPMKLMQYGMIQFSHGEENDFWIYPVAVKREDGKAERFHSAWMES